MSMEVGFAMYLELTMKQAVIRRTVRSFAGRKLSQVAEDMDNTQHFPEDTAKEMADLHYFGLEIPHFFGGAGLDPVSCAIVIEEISRVSAAMGLCISVHNSVSALPIWEFGTEAQKERFLVPLAKGKKIGTFCLTEPNAGSDVSSLETNAIKDGSYYILNGNKIFVTNGGVSQINLVFARSPESDGKKRFSVFVVESEREGLQKGPLEDLMGMRGNPVCPISFNDCRIPESNRLGAEGEGLKIALAALNDGRVGIAAQALGIAQGCIDTSLKHAKERHQFGRPIAEHQAVQNLLADTATRIEAARLLIYRACDMKEKGIRHGGTSAMAKLYASEVAVDAARTGVQIHGGYGYTKAYPIERFYRDAKACEIYEGTSEVQRMVIAHSLLSSRQRRTAEDR